MDIRSISHKEWWVKLLEALGSDLEEQTSVIIPEVTLQEVQKAIDNIHLHGWMYKHKKTENGTITISFHVGYLGLSIGGTSIVSFEISALNNGCQVNIKSESLVPVFYNWGKNERNTEISLGILNASFPKVYLNPAPWPNMPQHITMKPLYVGAIRLAFIVFLLVVLITMFIYT